MHSAQRILIVASIFVCTTFFGAVVLLAQEDAQALKEKILERNKQLLQLDREIKQYQSTLDQVSMEKQSLQSAVKTLDVSRSKVSTDIKATETKIVTTDLTIQELQQQISTTEVLINRNTEVIAHAIQKIDELESNSFLETLLAGDSMSEVWDSIAALSAFQSSLRGQVKDFLATKRSYENAKSEEAGKKEELSSLKGELSDRKKVLDTTHNEKNQLLSTTKEKESNYQKMLAEKKRQRELFEKELRNYESQLKFVLDKSTIPTAGASVFSWPFEQGYFADCPSFASALGNPHCITQYFGNTPFARSGAYSGNGHNGIDFRAPIGTKIIAALSGTVVGVGNTDTAPSCYSFGKWVLVRHNNGISTLYSHLSTISTAVGAQLATGGVIGYSGATGYATGPHLHFGVYASDGVSIKRFADDPSRPVTACYNVPIPIAAHSAYLNPMDYLPK